MKTSNIQANQIEVIELPESILADNSGKLWQAILKRFDGSKNKVLKIDASKLVQIDESGIALLFRLEHCEQVTEVSGLSQDIQSLYSSLTKNFKPIAPVKSKSLNWVSQLGKGLCQETESFVKALTFLGQSVSALFGNLCHPSRIRPGEILSVCTTAGSNAVGIVCLIGFLMGIIIAFETALVAKIFGAVIFVVNGIGVAMTRELGPLMTAILFAGRSGSAFAAQLGTQKVNEELNALTTFGLDPVFFLVVPRLIASTLVVPLLSIFATLIGIIGGGLVMGMYDITFTQFVVQLIGATTVTDILFGVFKAGIFGFIIAFIGCYCGLQTGAGAAAVGVSTTRSVVLSIVWIVVIDGVAALLMNRLGL